ncbi:hypothetical protein L9F63_017441, partial [Diploptera punctata]
QRAQTVFWVMSSVVAALEAHVICGRIPGLTARQRDMCRASPDAMVAVGDGVRLGTLECQQQFRHRRWNCSAIGSGSVFGHVVIVERLDSKVKRVWYKRRRNPPCTCALRPVLPLFLLQPTKYEITNLRQNGVKYATAAARRAR